MTRRTLVLAAVLALLCKLALAFFTFGTDDMRGWYDLLWYAHFYGARLYVMMPYNHPPFTIRLVQAVAWLAGAAHLGFPFLYRAVGALADAGSVWLVYDLLPPFEPRLRRICLLALSPTLILLTGFQGNNDAVMMFFVLLTIWLVQRHDLSGAWAGIAFAFATSVKVAPLMLLPIIVMRLFNGRWVRFGMALVLTTLLINTPYVFQEPAAIFHDLFGYKSIYGHWGVSWLLSHSGVQAMNFGYERFGSLIMFAVILAISIWMNGRSEVPPSLFTQVGVVFCLFLTLTPGFGIQYLAWACPFAILLDMPLAVLYYLPSTVFVAIVYDYWSSGKWYFANSTATGDWQGRFDMEQLLCWGAVVMVTYALLRKVKGKDTNEQRA